MLKKFTLFISYNLLAIPFAVAHGGPDHTHLSSNIGDLLGIAALVALIFIVSYVIKKKLSHKNINES